MDSKFYLKLKSELINRGYKGEIEWAENLELCNSAIDFFAKYMWVVISSGLKNQVARIIYDRIVVAMKQGKRPSEVFKHLGKTKAIESLFKNKDREFKAYQETSDKLSFLETLPWIGKITKYHLARNLGLDFCKPDRHLVRIAKTYNTTPDVLCKRLARETGDRIGTVDLVIWRAANLGIKCLNRNTCSKV